MLLLPSGRVSIGVVIQRGERGGKDSMPSRSLVKWKGERSRALDEIANAHLRVGGDQRGRRYATQQINQAYATLLSSQFQGFCRDLHSECIDHLVATAPAIVEDIFRAQFIWGRKLDHGNPNPGNVGMDFNRLGTRFWPAVLRDFHRNDRRREMLVKLNEWRNAIAHQDFDPGKLGGISLRLATVQRWRSAINCLAQSFDSVMLVHLNGLLSAPPW